MQRYIRLIILAGFTLLLAACGSSRSDEAEIQGPTQEVFGVDADGIAYIGADRCIGCHAGLFGGEQVIAYLDSKHVVHNSAINAASPASCLNCHDPIADGHTLERFIDPAQVPAAGLAAVGCENCHGAGGNHFGYGPLPKPSPDFATCGKCHTVLPVGPTAHAGNTADGILEEYVTGGHASTVKGGIPLATCSRCHSDEGFRAFIGATTGADANQIGAALAGAAPPATCRRYNAGPVTTVTPDHCGRRRSPPCRGMPPSCSFRSSSISARAAIRCFCRRPSMLFPSRSLISWIGRGCRFTAPPGIP